MPNEKPNYYSIIPANIRYDKRLQPRAVLLYGEITALTHTNGYCWATDSYFAELYKVSKTTVQSWLNSLEKCGYISRQKIYKEGTKEIKNRYIKILEYPTQENLGTYPRKSKDPTQENLRENTTVNNTLNNTNNNKPSKPPKPVAKRECFESLWKLYPNKKGKESAFNSYKRSIKDGVTDNEIKQGINNYLAEIKVKGTPKRYIKHGDTWFRQKGWQDEYDTTPDVAAGRKRPVTVRETLPDWAKDETTVPAPSNAGSIPTTEEINAKLAKLRSRRESR